MTQNRSLGSTGNNWKWVGFYMSVTESQEMGFKLV